MGPVTGFLFGVTVILFGHALWLHSGGYFLTAVITFCCMILSWIDEER